MKTLLILPLVFAVTNSLMAQESTSKSSASTSSSSVEKFGYLYGKESNPGIRFGARGGVAMSRFATSSGIEHVSSVTRANVGVYAEMPIQKYVYVQAGISYFQSGGTYMVGPTEVTKSTMLSVNQNYMQLPVTVVGKLAVGKSSNVFAGVGGYFGLGLGGKLGSNAAYRNGTSYREKRDIQYADYNVILPLGDDAGNMKQTDAGVQMIIGAEFNNVTINGQVLRGLTNIRPGGDGGLRNESVSINFGFLF